MNIKTRETVNINGMLTEHKIMNIMLKQEKRLTLMVCLQNTRS